MKKTIVACSLLICSSANGAAPPIPSSQWTPDAHVWLSRAMVAEAGWQADRDHVAIAYVLARRWRRVTERFTTLRFVDVVRTYCTGLGNYRRSITPRQQWLRSLDFSAQAPDGWPERVSWANHESFWRRALARSEAWFQGRLKDPCRGQAEHWGGVIDSPQGRMVAIDCGETRNTFYTLDRSER